MVYNQGHDDDGRSWEYNDFAPIRGNISPHMFYMNETCQQELHEARLRIDELTKKEETLNQDINKNRGSISDMERQLHDTKATMEKNLRDYDALLKKSQKVNLNRWAHRNFNGARRGKRTGCVLLTC